MKNPKPTLLAGMLLYAASMFSQANIEVLAPLNVNNSSSQSSGPTGINSQNYMRSCFLLNYWELAALTTNDITSFGFNLLQGITGNAVSGNITVYFQNTTDVYYQKGVNFTNALSGMTQVYSGNMNIPATTGTANIVVNFATPFNYTGGGIYVAFDWAATTPPVVNGAYYATNGASSSMGASRSSVTAITGNLSLSNFRPVCFFGAVNTAINELGIMSLVAPGKVAEGIHAPYVITADIKNSSINPLTNINVQLSVTGANPFSDTQVITTIAPGAVETVSFAAYTPVNQGLNYMAASLPADQVSNNNQLSWTQSVTCKVAGNGPPLAAYQTPYGFPTTSGVQASLFNFNATTTISAVNIFIAGYVSNNATAYCVLMDDMANIVAYTNTLTITGQMYQTSQTFTFTTEEILLPNTDYYIGFAQPAPGYMLGSFAGNPPPGKFFYMTPVTGGVLSAVDYAYYSIEPVFAGPAITITQPGTVICNGEAITLSADGAATYSWTSSVFNPIENPNDGAITVAPTSNEMYVLNYTDEGNCSGTVSLPVAVKPCLGLEANTANNVAAVLYPNPSANGKTTIAGLHGTNTVTVFNMLGQMVLSEITRSETIVIDMGGQPAGNYLVKIADQDQHVKTLKFVNQP